MTERLRRPHLACVALILVSTATINAEVRLRDGFENGAGQWTIHGDDVARIVETGEDGDHALALVPNGDSLVWLPEAVRWGNVRIEGRFMFPAAGNSYLGFAYNIQQTGDRFDFGLIYIKGNGSYIQVNPHRDFNVGRLLYPEYRVVLEGEDAIRIGEWKQFALEVSGSESHLYVGDMDEPKLTFSDLELASGAIGFQPRSVGDMVLIDDVTVHSIDRLQWSGSPRPDLRTSIASLPLRWNVAGPFEQTDDTIAREPDSFAGWRPFATDQRGAVVTGRVVDTHGPARVAYFRTTLPSSVDSRVLLHLSTIDDLAIWVNGRFHWFVPRGDAAWFDFVRNPRHEGHHIPIEIRKGDNEIVVRVIGGVYASGGFYATFQNAETTN